MAVSCNTKQACDDITRFLRDIGFHALALHGDLEQRERDQVLVLADPALTGPYRALTVIKETT